MCSERLGPILVMLSYSSSEKREVSFLISYCSSIPDCFISAVGFSGTITGFKAKVQSPYLIILQEATPLDGQFGSKAWT